MQRESQREEELCLGIMWSGHFLGARCSGIYAPVQESQPLAPLSPLLTATIKVTCSWLNLPSVSFSSFILKIRNGRATHKPSQHFSQIRPFSLFHNTRERKDKTLHSPLLYFCPVSLFIFVSLVTQPSTHAFSNPTGFLSWWHLQEPF